MILVTGGTGFIGQSLVKELLSEGRSIRILTRKPEEAKKLFPKAEAFKADILDPSSLKPALKGIEEVIHLAGKISYTLPKQELFRQNLEGTKNLLEASREAEKFLFSSSVSVYGETPENVDETSPPKPRDFYGESKLAAEEAVQASGIPSLVYRVSVVYGTGSPIWEGVMRLFSRGFPLPKTKNYTNLIHVSDVSRAFSLGLKKGNGIYNIAGEKSIPFIELASLLAYHFGIKPKFWPVWLVKFLASFKGRGKEIDTFIQNRLYETSKVQRDLGFKPDAYFEKEIKNMVEWYKSLPGF